MLYIKVHYLFHVTIFYSHCQLNENVQCNLLGKIGLAALLHITQQVPSRLEFRHNVDSVINLEVISDSEYVVTLLAAFLCIEL